MDKPTIPDVMPLVLEYYALPGNLVGGNLHIVLDDGNVKNSDVEFCINKCREYNDLKGIVLCELLLRMSKTQRLKLGYLPKGV